MDTSTLKIAILGAGNMGGAIARALCSGSLVPSKNISISDISSAKLEELKSQCAGLNTFTSNADAVKGADIVILAVKPWLIGTVAKELQPLSDKQTIVSIAAGVDLETLATYFGQEIRIFRVIPNTAIEVLQGVSTIASLHAGKADEELIVKIFSEMGKVYMVPESQLNAYMSLSSCGIAYAFRYIRAAMEGGVEMGIPAAQASQVVLDTLRGAVELLEKTASHPEVEIDKVTTPGGITIKGLNEMEANGFSNAVIKGLKASHIK